MPDDKETLLKLIETGLVETCPSQDSDDAYMIELARRENTFIVTNDMFRNHKKVKVDKTKLVSFAFAGS